MINIKKTDFQFLNSLLIFIKITMFAHLSWKTWVTCTKLHVSRLICIHILKYISEF